MSSSKKNLRGSDILDRRGGGYCSGSILVVILRRAAVGVDGGHPRELVSAKKDGNEGKERQAPGGSALPSSTKMETMYAWEENKNKDACSIRQNAHEGRAADVEDVIKTLSMIMDRSTKGLKNIDQFHLLNRPLRKEERIALTTNENRRTPNRICTTYIGRVMGTSYG